MSQLQVPAALSNTWCDVLGPHPSLQFLFIRQRMQHLQFQVVFHPLGNLLLLPNVLHLDNADVFEADVWDYRTREYFKRRLLMSITFVVRQVSISFSV